jgi:succinate dehydrogenase hydrophobic anchor subunit
MNPCDNEQHWKRVAKTKSVTNVSTKIKTITMTLLLLVKAFCHGWNSLKQEAA